jgi:hypothetical protein
MLVPRSDVLAQACLRSDSLTASISARRVVAVSLASTRSSEPATDVTPPRSNTTSRTPMRRALV